MSLIPDVFFKNRNRQLTGQVFSLLTLVFATRLRQRISLHSIRYLFFNIKKEYKNKSTMQWHLFPPPKPQSYRDGDLVFLRSKSAKEKGRRGIIISSKQGSTEQDSRRSLVRFSKEDGCSITASSTGDDGNKSNSWEKSVQTKRLLPVYDCDKTSAKLICTSETIHYRLLAASQLSQIDDHVLEIGCSTGEASHVIVRYANSWVGYDTSSEMIQQCTDKLATQTDATDHTCALKIDPFGDPRVAQETATKFNKTGPSVVFIDIGGNREINPVLQMISWSVQSFTPRLVIVKSRALVKHVREELTVDDLGCIGDAHEWFSKRIKDIVETKGGIGGNIPKHPLQAPLALSPEGDGKTPICRYHNYHPSGCSKGSDCPMDHNYCHWCLEKGHTAKMCTNSQTQAAP